MRRPKNTDRRVLGPYQDGREWRIAVIEPNRDEPRSDLTYPSESAAKKAKKQIEADWHRLAEITVDDGVTKYEAYLTRKGNKPGSIAETIRRLRLFFADVSEAAVDSLTKETCTRLYDDFADDRSVDYHRNTLAEARSFLRWCIERGWCKDNPLEAVKGLGKRKKGKKQLTRDEAIKFSDAARTLVDRKEPDLGALGAWMLLVMGLRQSEVWKRRVRDVDASATLLRVEDAKTAAGNRLVEIPEMLRPFLAALVDGRDGSELLFGEHTKAWLRFAVKRVCTAAKVPQVTPHGLRGTHSSLSAVAGATAHLVAAQLGHESTTTTLAHYTDASAVQAAKQAAALKVINGGRR